MKRLQYAGRINENGAMTVTAFPKGPLRELSVPETIDGYRVAAIDWEQCALAEPAVLRLPGGITRIEDYAYSENLYLLRLYLSEGTEAIGESAFYACTNLDFVSFPSSLLEIGSHAFAGCALSGPLDLPNGLRRLADEAFADTGILYLQVPGGVRTVPRFCFYKCRDLMLVRLYNGIQRIAEGAFSGCSLLRSIRIPPSVTEIAPDAFSDAGRKLEIIGETGSAAHAYAEKMGFRFTDSMANR